MEAVPLKIDANDRTVREILDKKKYNIDFFQREYRWERKHVEQLLSDLESRFLQDYKPDHSREDVQHYSRYYLGPIVLSEKSGGLSIIDGQQRLTSLTLLLIYLNNSQRSRPDKIPGIENLIFSEKYAKKSFNMDVEDRVECMEALYRGQDYDTTNKSESVKNIVKRYNDIQELFPDELEEGALPYFLDWLTENVVLVEIITYSDDDAYTIFETMNDRGLNLTPTEMLKGYMITNITDEAKKHEINDMWKRNIQELNEIEKDKDLEFFKTWLRAKYAESIRPGRKGAANEDFEKIGTRFHSWVRDNRDKIGLRTQDDFYNFIKRNFNFYHKLYLKILEAENRITDGLEHLYYVKERNFTLHYPILMAPIKITDDEKTIIKKLSLVARFIETFILCRSINYRTLAYSSIRYTMFSLVKELRDKDIPELVNILKEKIKSFDENLSGLKSFALHSQNKRFVHFLLARMTHHIERRSQITSRFENYVDSDLTIPYEIEHIWSNNYEEHRDEFGQRDEFEEFRNKIGGLILLPKDFNQSYGELPYEQKLSHYFGQNLLARTLNPQCYERNPNFLRYKEESALPFKHHEHFKKKDLEEQQELYLKICEEIWSLDGFDEIANS